MDQILNSIIVCVCVKSHSRVKADSRSGRRSINLITNHKNVIVWEIRTCARDYLLLVLHAVLFVDPARYLSTFDDDDVTERRAIFPEYGRETDRSFRVFTSRDTRERRHLGFIESSFRIHPCSATRNADVTRRCNLQRSFGFSNLPIDVT